MKTPPLQVPGFRAAGVHCGVKASPDQLDLALIASDRRAAIAGVFTRSTVVGAPVEWCRERVRAGAARAVVVNSGISNVAMGDRGRRDAAEMASRTSLALGIPTDEVFVASTGVIGEPLPMPRIRDGIRNAASALDSGGLSAAAEAIRTTDTFAKTASATARVGGQTVTVSGVAKGSGMIEPNMATMLAFMLTDANVSPAHLRRVLKRAVNASFNRLTIDGEGSTSDTVLLLANGAAAHRKLAGPKSVDAEAFAEAVEKVAVALTRDLARDGEGATKLVTVRVRGAVSPAQAERAVRRIANSMLVKTALFGGDANWGRILQTLGAGRITLDLERCTVDLGGVTVFRGGASSGPAARRRAAKRLEADEIDLLVDLGAGDHAAHVWTCDLSTDYVRINAEYTT